MVEWRGFFQESVLGDVKIAQRPWEPEWRPMKFDWGMAASSAARNAQGSSEEASKYAAVTVSLGSNGRVEYEGGRHIAEDPLKELASQIHLQAGKKLVDWSGTSNHGTCPRDSRAEKKGEDRADTLSTKGIDDATWEADRAFVPSSTCRSRLLRECWNSRLVSLGWSVCLGLISRRYRRWTESLRRWLIRNWLIVTGCRGCGPYSRL